MRTNLFLWKTYEKPLHYCIGFCTDANFWKCIENGKDNSKRKRTMAIKAVIVQADLFFKAENDSMYHNLILASYL